MACPVCFGSVAPAVSERLNAGVFVLLGVTVVVHGCFLRFFVALARRLRASARLDATPDLHHGPPVPWSRDSLDKSRSAASGWHTRIS